ncbi:MAG: hypothetical protein ABIP53_08010 [Candidatus Limnocylindrales bacterium]
MTDPPRNEGLADGASDDEVAARRGLAARDRDIASGTNRRPHEFSRDVGVRAQSAEPHRAPKSASTPRAPVTQTPVREMSSHWRAITPLTDAVA